jgi:hypothetical protein
MREPQRLVEPEAQGESVRRVFTDTSLYETAIALYPILLGLILTDSLKNMAVNIVDHPIRHANWSMRLLTVALLILSVLWLHVWIATFRSTAVVGVPDGHHKSYPGIRMEKVEGYGAALSIFWLGVVQLILFACMAYSVSDEREFFVESALYSLILFLYSALEIKNDRIRSERSGVQVWRRPLHSIAELWRGRHLPISAADLEQHAEGRGEDLQLLLARGHVYDTFMAIVLIALSVILDTLAWELGQSWWIALLALIGTAVSVALDYYVYPYFYLL